MIRKAGARAFSALCLVAPTKLARADISDLAVCPAIAAGRLRQPAF